MLYLHTCIYGLWPENKVLLLFIIICDIHLLLHLFPLLCGVRPLARNGNFFKNAVIQKKIAVTSKTIVTYFSRSLD